MATPVFCCGLECGPLGLAHWTNQGGNGTRSIVTSGVLNGLRSLNLANSATADNGSLAGVATGSNGGSFGLSGTSGVGRYNIQFNTALPTQTTFLIGGVTDGIYWGAYFNASDSKIYAGTAVGSLGASGVSVTTGVEYRIDVKCDFSANPWLIDVQVNGSACGQRSTAQAAGTTSQPAIGFKGWSGNLTADMTVDDVLYSVTSGDYPLGAGYILSYIPNVDGTHNVAGANDFERTLTGTDITNATTDAYTLIDKRPLSTTADTFINGIAPPNSTDYVEWGYEDSAESVAPRTVEAIIVHHDAGGAGTNNFQVTLREPAAPSTAFIHNGTTNVGSTLTVKRVHFATVPGTSDAWTDTKFDALRSRFLVADASPDPYIDAAMLEAEFPDSGVSATVTGVAATAEATGAVGVVTAVQIVSASITGVAATITADALAGAILIARTVTGEAATATADAPAGTVAAIQIVSISGVAATADANAPAGTVAALQIVSVVGEAATATADGLAGAVLIARTIPGEAATATADALAGAVAAIQIVSISGVAATADADALAGTVSVGGASATVAGEPATATADAPAGTVAAIRIVSITGVAATANADAPAGTVAAQVTTSIAGVSATAEALAIAGVIAAIQIAAITGVIATASAEALVGAVIADVTAGDTPRRMMMGIGT